MRLLFAGFVAALGAQRLSELRLSRRNEARMHAHGGREHASETYRWIVSLHAAWFGAMLLEVFACRRKFRPRLAALAIGLFAAGQALRLSAIHTLGWRWSTRVMTVPGEAPVQRGIYRYMRHPNYLGVQLEILAAPLVHSAYLTSAVFGAANALLLRARIRQEEQALDAYGRDNGYRELFEGRLRFVPHFHTAAGQPTSEESRSTLKGSRE